MLPPSSFPRRQAVPLIMLLAVLIGVAGLGINFYHGQEGQAATPQIDTLLFHQYARALGGGHPYRFNANDPPSTGSTSHLFPAVLAAFYALGLRGEGLATANLLLNFACYLASLGLVLAIARRLDPRAAPLAALLCVLSGQTFISFFLMSDIGLFTVLALGALAAALGGRRGWLCLTLVLAAWCRPEGFMLSGAALATALAPGRWFGDGGPRSRRGLLTAGALGVAAFGAAALLNRALTGSFQFQSVQGKGLIPMNGLFGGVYLTARTLADVVQQGLFNLGSTGRSFYSLPVAGGLLGLLGLAARLGRSKGRRLESGGGLQPAATGQQPRVVCWFLGTALASVVLVAASSWDGMQYDKYWTWFLPVWTIHIAIGLRAAARRLRWRGALPVAALLLAGYQALGLGHFMAAYGRDCAALGPLRPFVRRAEAGLPATGRLGCWGACGLAYYLERHPLYNVAGICAPQYRSGAEPCQTMEALRHRPELRFDAWLINAPDAEQWFKPLVGAQLAAAPPVFGGGFAFTLHRAVWDALEGTTQPLTAGLVPAGARLMDSMDVGYAPDEARSEYDLYTRLAGARLAPRVAAGSLGGRAIAEVGRVVIGMESFRARVRPGQAARLVLRGMFEGEAGVLTPDYQGREQHFEFGSPLTLNVLVDDQPAGRWIIERGAGAENIFERSFELPAGLLRREQPVITVGGDHIALGYWIYQSR